MRYLALLAALLSLGTNASPNFPDLSDYQKIDKVAGTTSLSRNVGVIGNQVIFKDFGVWKFGPKLPVTGSGYTDKYVYNTDRFIAIGSNSEHKVWLYERENAFKPNWTLSSTIELPDDVDPQLSQFGESVYLDDQLLTISDPKQRSIYIYLRNSGEWQLVDKLDVNSFPDPTYRSLGFTVRRYANELYVSESSAERIFIFRTRDLNTWHLGDIIESPDKTPTQSSQFGFAFDVNKHFLVVSSYTTSYVHVFMRRHPYESWSLQQTIKQADIDTETGYFGHDVELDRTTFMIGDDALGKVYRFDIQKGKELSWQLAEIFQTGDGSSRYGSSFGFESGTLLIGDISNSHLFSRPTSKVNIEGYVYSQDGIPVQNADVRGYFSSAKTDVNGAYTLPVPRGWSGSLYAEKFAGAIYTSQTIDINRTYRDVTLEDLTISEPIMFSTTITISGSCRDTEMYIEEIPRGDQDNVFSRFIQFDLRYGTSGTLTPISEMCDVTPSQIEYDFVDENSIFSIRTQNKE
ncbi:hypothetical protein HRJ45_14570 [Vibrio coralliilyticus]|uniref:carboxypeptidase-like regulatory domain-containing protein n=1 Tax=Vibrio coralliilyticus TaxID=190893 RepID=UPI0015611CE0|nr:carboxypeptidase-like regulatory domain-containing protein [Vibrio coralliilyticus]NRF26183.1 hypothetical protein [Vibrio coralliilyticus]NRF80334.1 hypothetical protein [Vibrio coralliilyticus]